MKSIKSSIAVILLFVGCYFIFHEFADSFRQGMVVSVDQASYSTWVSDLVKMVKDKQKLPEISVQVFLQDNPKEIWEVSNKNQKIRSESLLRILNLIKETSLLNMPNVQDPNALVLHVKTDEKNFHAVVSKEKAMSNIKVLTLMKLMEQNNQNRQMRRKQKRLEANQVK